MPTYRPPVSRDQLQQLEHYLFALLRLTLSQEFVLDLDSQKKSKILGEMHYIDMTINILKHTFRGTGNDIPIVGWDDYDSAMPSGYRTVYRFTSAATAAVCLDLNNSHVTAVCKGDRSHVGGWTFMYLSEYEDIEPLDYGPNGVLYDIKKL